jgi:hypothetical protein
MRRIDMKNRIIALISVVALIVMTLPAVSPPPVSAGGASVDFRQYANEDDEWIGSILQASNSKYYECMSVPQRTILDSIPSTAGGVHTFNFKHEATKSGTHAYDLLTAYNQGNDPPLDYDSCGEKMGHTPNYTAICESLHTSGYDILVEVPDDPFMSKDGSTQDRIDAYEAQFGERRIKIYGDQPFAAAALTLSHIDSSGDPLPDGGDGTGSSYIEYELTWTSNSTQILIEMGGHLALSGDPGTNAIAWGPGLGSSQINGGPYHFSLGELDGSSLGNQDNQIKGADILEIVIDARISITESDTNKLGDPHTFTIHVEENDGTGWDDASGETVVPSIASGPAGALITSTGPYVTDANGEVQVTVDSDTNVGVLELDATCAVSVGGITVNVDTNGYGAYDISNEKTWVDARISIYESGVNPVGQPHDFTITVEKYFDESTGWIPAAGVNVTGTTTFGILTGSPAPTNSEGKVTFTVNSYVAGTAIVHASATVSICDIDIAVATDGYGWYVVDNTKRWTDGNGGYSCSCCYECELTVDWEGCITSKPLYCSNDKLAVDLLGPSFDLIHNLFLEQGTHAPVVYKTTHYLIIVRELEEIPALPENTEAIVVFNITPADAEFNRDIFLTLGIDELPENALNVTMAYYDDVNGVWVLIESEAGGPNGVAELTLSAPINHFSIFGVLAELEPTPPPQPAHFVASGLNIEPSVERIWEPVTFVTKTGESVTITANVANDGWQEGTYTVELKLNGETVDTKMVTVGAGQSKPVSFTRAGLDYGQYEVEVAGLSGEFTTSRTITWWLILVIIAAIGLIIWGVVWGRRRRRRAAQEG